MTFWNILLLLLGVLSLCATICIMALGAPFWLSTTNSIVTVIIWWAISHSGFHTDDD